MRRVPLSNVARRLFCGWTTPPDSVTHDVHMMSQVPRSPIQLRTLLGLFDTEYRLETNNRTYPNAAAFTHDQITMRLTRILDRFNHLPYVTVRMRVKKRAPLCICGIVFDSHNACNLDE